MEHIIANCKAYVRLRPSTQFEKNNNQEIVSINQEHNSVSVDGPGDKKTQKQQNFVFQAVYDSETSQEKIFCQSTKPLIESAFEGHNAALISYGQSGSGKTHTLEGNDYKSEFRGMIPRTIDEIFEHIEQMQGRMVTVRMSYVYILNDEITDLLNNNSNAEKANLSLHSDGPVSFEDILLKRVSTADEFNEWYKLGRKKRLEEEENNFDAQGKATTILTIEIECCEVKGDVLGDIKSSRMQFVDLAHNWEPDDNILMQGPKRSMSGNKRKSHVRHPLVNIVTNINVESPEMRKSVSVQEYVNITHILSGYFGGNCHTVVIGHISPLKRDQQETLETLKVLHRIQKIKNKRNTNLNLQTSRFKQMKDEYNHAREQYESSIKQLEDFIVNKDCVKKIKNQLPEIRVFNTQGRLESTREETLPNMVIPGFPILNANNSINQSALNDSVIATGERSVPRSLKIIHEKEIHLLLQFPTTFKSLVDNVKLKFKNLPSQYMLQYEDSENDTITLSTEEDYKNMLEVELPSQQRALKIYVIPNVQKDKILIEDFASTTSKKGRINSIFGESQSSFQLDDELKSIRGRRIITDDSNFEEEKSNRGLSSDKKVKDSIGLLLAGMQSGGGAVQTQSSLHNISLNGGGGGDSSHRSRRENSRGRTISELFNENLYRLTPQNKNRDARFHSARPNYRNFRKYSHDSSFSQELNQNSVNSPLTDRESNGAPQNLKLSSKIHSDRDSYRNSSFKVLKSPKGDTLQSQLQQQHLNANINTHNFSNFIQQNEPLPTISSEVSQRPTLEQRFTELGDEENDEDVARLGDNNTTKTQKIYKIQLIKECTTSPPVITLTPTTIYKVISIKNNGEHQWPTNSFLESEGVIQGTLASLPELSPGKETVLRLTLQSPEKLGKWTSTWQFYYLNAESEKVYVDQKINVHFEVKKPNRSSSVSGMDDLYSGVFVNKAKKMKDKIPYAKFEDLIRFVSKQDQNASIEMLVEQYNS